MGYNSFCENIRIQFLEMTRMVQENTHQIHCVMEKIKDSERGTREKEQQMRLEWGNELRGLCEKFQSSV